MKLTFAESGEIYAEWSSDFGAHSRNVTTELPEELTQAVREWGDKREAELRAEWDSMNTKRDLQFQINQLQERVRQLG